MPIYEYRCTDCDTQFDQRRAYAQADAPAQCPRCQSEHSRRLISRVACFTRGADGASEPLAGAGGACAGCTSGSCVSCSHH